MTEHCSTCKHWDRDVSPSAAEQVKTASGQPTRECLKLDDKASLMKIECYSEGMSESGLYTAADFGCVQHKPVET